MIEERTSAKLSFKDAKEIRYGPTQEPELYIYYRRREVATIFQKIYVAIKDLISRKQNIPGCGVWPLRTPSWDIFHAFCMVHDSDYSISASVYAKGVVNRYEEGKSEGLQMKLLADEVFFESCRTRASNSFILFRGIATAWAELYIGLVMKNSRDIWFTHVGQIIADWEKSGQARSTYAGELTSAHRRAILYRGLSREEYLGGA